MTQKFSNNFDGALASTLVIAGTSASLINASGLSTPTGGAFELLTLTDGSLFEVVRMTARSANTLTITRAQEGTTAREWPAATRVFAGVTAGTLLGLQEPTPTRLGPGTIASGTNAVALGINSEATAANAVAVGVNADATVDSAVAVGDTATATAFEAVAIGWNSRAWADGAVAVGWTWADGVSSVAIGYDTAARTASSIAIGEGAVVLDPLGDGSGAIAIGQYAWSEAKNAIQIGVDGIVFGDNCISLGRNNIDSSEADIFQVGALPAVGRAHFWKDQSNAHWSMVACQSVIMSEKINLRATTTHTITIPTAARFFVDEVGLVITDASGVTTQPTVRWGITGETEKFVAATLLTGLDAAHKRQRFTSLSSTDGVGTLRVEITIAGAGTDLRGRFYWKGFAVVNTP